MSICTRYKQGIILLLLLCSNQVFAGAIDKLLGNRYLGNNGACPNLNVGNPVNLATGNKYQEFTVFKGAGEFPLDFTMRYNSRVYNTKTRRYQGVWMHSYASTAKRTGRIIKVVHEDGSYSSYEVEDQVDWELVSSSPTIYRSRPKVTPLDSFVPNSGQRQEVATMEMISQCGGVPPYRNGTYIDVPSWWSTMIKGSSSSGGGGKIRASHIGTGNTNAQNRPYLFLGTGSSRTGKGGVLTTSIHSPLHSGLSGVSTPTITGPRPPTVQIWRPVFGCMTGWLKIERNGVINEYEMLPANVTTWESATFRLKAKVKNKIRHNITYNYQGRLMSFTVTHSNGKSLHMPVENDSLSVNHIQIARPAELILSNGQTSDDRKWSFDYDDDYNLVGIDQVASQVNTGPAHEAKRIAHFRYEAQPGTFSGNEPKWYERTALTGYQRNQSQSTHLSGWAYDSKGRAFRSWRGPYYNNVATTNNFPFSQMTEAYEFTDFDEHRVRTVTNRLGKSTTFTFEPVDGNFVELKSVSGSATVNCAASGTSYEYYREDNSEGFQGQMKKVTDAKGYIKEFAYHKESGLRKSVTHAKGTVDEITVNYDWHDDREKLKSYETDGLKVEFNYYDNDRIKEIIQTDRTQPVGLVSDRYDSEVPSHANQPERNWFYTYTFYDANQTKPHFITIDGPRNDAEDWIRYVYTEEGNLDQIITDPGTVPGLELIYQYKNYNHWGLPELLIDPNGVETVVSYWKGAEQILVSSIKVGVENAYTFEYDEKLNRLEKVNYPNGNWIEITYSGTDIRYIENNVGDKIDINTKRIAADQVTTKEIKVEANGFFTGVYYHAKNTLDALNRLYKSTEGIGNNHPNNGDKTFAEYNYDRNSNLSNVKEGFHTVINHELQFNGLNQLMSIASPDAGTTELDYDDEANMDEVTDAENRETTYIYNGFGEVIQRTSPDTGVTKYFYDEAGNLIIEVRDAGSIISKRTSYEYDSVNRLVSTKYSDTDVYNESYVYDVSDLSGATYPRGRLTKVSKQDHEYLYGYDFRGRLTAQERLSDNPRLTGANSYTYNPQTGNLMSFSTGPHAIVGYQFDSFNRTFHIDVDVKQNGSTVTKRLIRSVEYYPFGPIRKYRQPTSNLWYEAQYTKGYLLENIEKRINATIIVGSGTEFFRETISRNRSLGNIDHIEMDVGGDAWGGFYHLKYDDNQRLIEAERASKFTFLPGPGKFNYTYNNIGDRQTKKADGFLETYIYEDIGDGKKKISAGSKFWEFDRLGQLRFTHKIVPLFNKDGNLSSVYKYPEGIWAQYYYNAFNQRVLKRLSDGSEYYYAYGPDGELVTEKYYANSSTSSYTQKNYIYLYGDLVNILITENGHTEIYDVTTDHLGTPVVITDKNGNTVWESDYSPFGIAYIKTEQIKNNVRFPGQYYDEESGFHYNWHRYYDPSLGRYLSSDPLGLVDGPNTYAYVGGNPVNFSDSSGLSRNVSPIDHLVYPPTTNTQPGCKRGPNNTIVCPEDPTCKRVGNKWVCPEDPEDKDLSCKEKAMKDYKKCSTRFKALAGVCKAYALAFEARGMKRHSHRRESFGGALSLICFDAKVLSEFQCEIHKVEALQECDDKDCTMPQ